MTLKEIFALISVFFAAIGSGWYIYLVGIKRSEKIRPVLPSWIVITVTMSLSAITYWTTKKHSLVGGAFNIASVGSTSSILITVWITKLRTGDKKITFSPFQTKCLWTSAWIGMLWALSLFGLKGLKHAGDIANILTQILMVVGYTVTAEKVRAAESNTEPFFTWACIATGSIIGIYPGLVNHDWFAVGAGARTALTAGPLIWLMYKAEKRGRAKALAAAKKLASQKSETKTS